MYKKIYKKYKIAFGDVHKPQLDTASVLAQYSKGFLMIIRLSPLG